MLCDRPIDEAEYYCVGSDEVYLGDVYLLGMKISGVTGAADLEVFGFEQSTALIGRDFFQELTVAFAADWDSKELYIGDLTRAARLFLKGIKFW